MALNIKNQEVERLAHALAEATGETLTDAVGEALRERLAQVQRGRAPSVGLLREVRQIQQTIAQLPIRDARDPEQILYDDNGLPR
jgi:antitoxin VapB